MKALWSAHVTPQAIAVPTCLFIFRVSRAQRQGRQYGPSLPPEQEQRLDSTHPLQKGVART